MKSHVAGVAVVATLALFGPGCSQNRHLAEARRENAQLRGQVSMLEAQVAELKARGQGPLKVDGLTLASPEVGELRWAPKPPARTEPAAEPNWQLKTAGGVVFRKTEIEGGVRSGAPLDVHRSLKRPAGDLIDDRSRGQGVGTSAPASSPAQ